MQVRFERYGDLHLAPTSAQFAGILRFMYEEVKKKDCYKGLLEVPSRTPADYSGNQFT